MLELGKISIFVMFIVIFVHYSLSKADKAGRFSHLAIMFTSLR